MLRFPTPSGKRAGDIISRANYSEIGSSQLYKAKRPIFEKIIDSTKLELASPYPHGFGQLNMPVHSSCSDTWKL
jgi:hypothetical protein